MKTQFNIPGILGGMPEFDKVYHLVKPLFPPIDDMVKGLKKLSKIRYLSNQGYCVQTLEKKLAEFLNVDNCALFCNGTIAEMCLFKCLNIKGSVLWIEH